MCVYYSDTWSLTFPSLRFVVKEGGVIRLAPNSFLFQAMYAKIDTDDEGDVTIKKVVEHIRAVEAGSGNNDWVETRTRSFPKNVVCCR